MGSEDLFYKGTECRKKRTKEIIEQRATTWLIVCEGKVTEKKYFEKLSEYINQNGKNKINLCVKGTGRNTKSVIESVDGFFDEIDKEVRKSKNTI